MSPTGRDSVTALGDGRRVAPADNAVRGGGVAYGQDLGLVFGAAINDGIEPFPSAGHLTSGIAPIAEKRYFPYGDGS